MNIKGSSEGFALPSVLIAGLVAMMVLMTSLAASSGTRVAMDQQYYQQLAREAAESGVNLALDCLQKNGYVSQWAGRNLTPKTNCSGVNITSYNNYLTKTDTIESTFIVDSLPAQPDVKYLGVTGLVKLKRKADGSVWKTIEHRQLSRISTEIGTGSIAFGYQHRDISSRGVYFATIARDGVVMSTGYNNDGQLGHGNTNPSSTPQPFQLPTDVRVKKMVANFLSAGQALYAVTYEGEVYAAGANDVGQLGLGNTTSPITIPQKINIGTEKAVHVDGSSHATYIVTESGKILTSGSCVNGALGTGSSCPDRQTMAQVALPAGSGAATEKFVTDRRSAYVITDSGRVYGWGENEKGQLARGNTTNSSVPMRIGSFGTSWAPAVDIAFDGQSLYVLASDGRLYVAGSNEDYEFGFARSNSSTLVRIDTYIASKCSGKIISVKTDRSHVAVLTDSGQVCTFGRNHAGQLGHGLNSSRELVKRITIPASGVRAVGISVNAIGGTTTTTPNNTFVVGSDGAVYGTGANSFGQLGNASTTQRNSLVKMRVFGSSEPAAEVQSGYGTTVIYTKSGRVYTVGNNDNGQLGDGTTTNRTTPAANRYTNIGPPIFF